MIVYLAVKDAATMEEDDDEDGEGEEEKDYTSKAEKCGDSFHDTTEGEASQKMEGMSQGISQDPF